MYITHLVQTPASDSKSAKGSFPCFFQMGGDAAVGWPFQSYRHFKMEDEGDLHLALAITPKAFKSVFFCT